MNFNGQDTSIVVKCDHNLTLCNNKRTSCCLIELKVKASSLEDQKKYTHKNVARACGKMLITLIGN